MVAVISAPAMSRRWYAVTDRGAFDQHGTTLHVSARARVSEAILSIAAPHRFAAHPKTDPRFVDADQRLAALELADTAAAVVGMGGFAMQMAVAEGRIDASVDPWGEIWDLAAPTLIVREAGGRVTDLSGATSITSRSLVVSNGQVHDEVLSAFMWPV